MQVDGSAALLGILACPLAPFMSRRTRAMASHPSCASLKLLDQGMMLEGEARHFLLVVQFIA